VYYRLQGIHILYLLGAAWFDSPTTYNNSYSPLLLHLTKGLSSTFLKNVLVQPAKLLIDK
jgi:hypothetical protein